MQKNIATTSTFKNKESQSSIKSYLEDLSDVYHLHYTLQTTGKSSNEWFEVAFTSVNVDLGPRFATILKLWIELESFRQWKSPTQGMSLPKTGKLSTLFPGGTSVRLPVLTDVASLKAFAECVWSWWGDLQPAWRSKSGGKPAPFEEFGAEWKNLLKSGKYGWFRLIVCLKLWGCGIRELEVKDEELENDWQMAVEDMLKMLQGVLYHVKEA